jgi:CPA1 family monovalent cation:H+ antiporter
MIGELTISVVEGFVALVTAAALVALVARRIAVPYTVALVFFGIAAAVFAPNIDVAVTPELVLAVMLPGLIFEASYQLDANELRRSFGGVTLLAVPGVLLTAVIVAAVLYFATGLRFELGFVVGAMVSATDPVAVISTFKRLAVPGRLTTLVEGESLFNDGTALVVFAISLTAVQGSVSLVDGVMAFLATIAVSVVIGLVIGIVGSRIIASVDDHLIELTVSLAMAYGAYLVADLLHESGVIATVIAGIVLGTYGKAYGMRPKTQEALDTVWEFIAFLLTALAFLLVGLVITVPQLIDSAVPIAWAVVAVLFARALVVYLLLGGTGRLIADRFHARIPMAWLHVMFWAGLRGAVAVAMALALPSDFPQRELLQEMVFGVVLFTLIVQGTTTDLVVRRVGARRPHQPAPEPERTA